ncbi:hypothetical protein T492DRAFT_1107312 [Pavlovales sp. CCMP2436]|nr:hypothetical protein T492DRAFT_1107312 [Pavlovales sp. CCMP2436]
MTRVNSSYKLAIYSSRSARILQAVQDGGHYLGCGRQVIGIVWHLIYRRQDDQSRIVRGESRAPSVPFTGHPATDGRRLWSHAPWALQHPDPIPGSRASLATCRRTPPPARAAARRRPGTCTLYILPRSRSRSSARTPAPARRPTPASCPPSRPATEWPCFSSQRERAVRPW